MFPHVGARWFAFVSLGCLYAAAQDEAEKRHALTVDGEFFGKEVHLPEYEWEQGRLGLDGFGFFRASNDEGWVTGHVVNYTPFERVNSVAGGIEYSQSNDGLQVQAAPSLRITKVRLPLIDVTHMLFEELRVSWYFKIAGKGESPLPANQLGLDWKTRILKVGKVHVVSEGFTRPKAGMLDGHVWFSTNWTEAHRFAIGSAVDAVNGKPSIALGLQIAILK